MMLIKVQARIINLTLNRLAEFDLDLFGDTLLTTGTHDENLLHTLLHVALDEIALFIVWKLASVMPHSKPLFGFFHVILQIFPQDRDATVVNDCAAAFHTGAGAALEKPVAPCTRR